MMRTTVTLDPDVAAALKRIARERGGSFKKTLNDVLRRGLADARNARPYTVPARPMGVRPDVNLDKSLAVASMDEDSAIVRKLELRK